MSELRVVMTGEEHALFNALQKVIDQSNKADDSFQKNTKTSTEAEKAAVRAAKAQEKAARDGARAADRLFKKNETLKESYKRRKAEIEAAGEAGKKSEEDVAKAVNLLKQEVLAEARAAKEAERQKEEAALKSSAAYRQQQDQIRKGVTKVEQLKRANMSLESQYDELRSAIKAAFEAGELSADEYKTSLRELDDEHDKLQKQNVKSFGDKATEQIVKFGGAFLSVVGGINVVTEALRFMSEEKDRAVKITDSLEDARRSLRQVSDGDAAELEKRAEQLESRFGLGQIESRRLVFDARSTGFEGEESTVAFANSVIAIDDGSKLAGQFRQQFSNEDLSIENAFDSSLAAAKQSVANISELLPQIQTAAQGAKQIGASSSDVLAVTSVFAGVFGESGGRRVRALQENIAASDGFEGLDLIEAIKKLRDDDDLRAEFTGGNKELQTTVSSAIRSLEDFVLDGKNVSGILTADRAIEQAQRDDVRLLRDKVLETFDPSNNAGRVQLARLDLKIQEAKQRQREEGLLSETEFSNRAFIQRKVNEQETGIARFGTSKLLGLQSFLGFDLQASQATLDRLDGESPETRGSRNEALLTNIVDVLTEIRDDNNQPLSIPGEDR